MGRRDALAVAAVAGGLAGGSCVRQLVRPAQHRPTTTSASAASRRTTALRGGTTRSSATRKPRCLCSPIRGFSLFNVVGHNDSKPRIVLSAAIMLSKLRLPHAAPKVWIVAPTCFESVALFLIRSRGAHLRGRESACRNIPADVYLRPERPFDLATFGNGTLADNHYCELGKSFCPTMTPQPPL